MCNQGAYTMLVLGSTMFITLEFEAGMDTMFKAVVTMFEV